MEGGAAELAHQVVPDERELGLPEGGGESVLLQKQGGGAVHESAASLERSPGVLLRRRVRPGRNQVEQHVSTGLVEAAGHLGGVHGIRLHSLQMRSQVTLRDPWTYADARLRQVEVLSGHVGRRKGRAREVETHLSGIYVEPCDDLDILRPEARDPRMPESVGLPA